VAVGAVGQQEGDPAQLPKDRSGSNSAVRVARRLVEEAQRLCEVLAQIVAKVRMGSEQWCVVRLAWVSPWK
jgi:hypothetical protein